MAPNSRWRPWWRPIQDGGRDGTQFKIAAVMAPNSRWRPWWHPIQDGGRDGTQFKMAVVMAPNSRWRRGWHDSIKVCTWCLEHTWPPDQDMREMAGSGISSTSAAACQIIAIWTVINSCVLPDIIKFYWVNYSVEKRGLMDVQWINIKIAVVSVE